MLKVTLKKPWRSKRGRVYEAGTVFVKTKMINRSGTPGAWYDYTCPGGHYGFVFLPDAVFKAPTDEEKWLRELRARSREKHIKDTDPLKDL